MPNIENEEGNYEPTLYIPKSLIRAGFWVKNHPGDMAFVSGLATLGIAVSLILLIGGTAGIAGLFLVLVAGFLLCGKAIYPESGNEKPSFDR